MSKEIKDKVVPKLRFPEFRDDEGWKEEKLKGICKMQAGKFVSASEIKANKESGLFPCYGGNGLRGYTKSYTNTGKYSLIGRQGALCGNITLVDGKFHATEHAVVVTPENGADTDWLFYLLIRLNLNQYATGQAQPGLSVETLEKIDTLISKTKEEQQKIAACLSSLDDLITAQNQKLEALKAHKKGLMQQLFPAEGETVPKLRFAEFKDSGEWEEKTVSEVAHYENGKAHEQDIVEAGSFTVVNSKFISSDGEVRKFTNTAFCLAKKGDILMVLSDVPNGKAIAKCFLVDVDNLYSVNQRICKLTPHDADNIFLSYILNRNAYFLSFDDGVKQTNLRNEDVLNCPILLPKNLDEQNKIAFCLSSLDKLITEQAEKIESLKAHKKGLMQQLFPTINEAKDEQPE